MLPLLAIKYCAPIFTIIGYVDDVLPLASKSTEEHAEKRNLRKPRTACTYINI